MRSPCTPSPRHSFSCGSSSLSVKCPSSIHTHTHTHTHTNTHTHTHRHTHTLIPNRAIITQTHTHSLLRERSSHNRLAHFQPTHTHLAHIQHTLVCWCFVHVLVLVCVCLFVCLCACVHLSERVCMHVCVLCVSEMDSYKHVCVYIFPLLTVACHYRGTSANVFCSSKKRLFK